ncbi:MAG: type 1 glutamine amidotransferase [Chloroflexota bacterium]|nr:type 1 glutamine amidotransferase [Chloroflexota bacterium]PLS79959.1 MAG: peptidase C56 [Chloroflexota bacterium]
MFGFGKKKARLKQARIAVLVTDGVEQAQLDAAVKQLRNAGAETFIVSTRSGKVQAFHSLKPSSKIPVDVTLDEVHPASFAALVIPGGTFHTDRLRQNERAREFVRAFMRSGKPVAAIGHAPLLLASADVLQGRRLTSWPGIKDDLVHAGGEWVDEPYVLDGNLLSARANRDLSKFSKQLTQHVAQLAEV